MVLTGDAPPRRQSLFFEAPPQSYLRRATQLKQESGFTRLSANSGKRTKIEGNKVVDSLVSKLMDATGGHPET